MSRFAEYQMSYLGKESFVIIISFVRSSSDTSGEIRSDLLESLQRMNVAITRAKYKMILGLFEFDLFRSIIIYLIFRLKDK